MSGVLDALATTGFAVSADDPQILPNEPLEQDYPTFFSNLSSHSLMPASTDDDTLGMGVQELRLLFVRRAKMYRVFALFSHRLGLGSLGLWV
jgi:hypothetical protein